MRRSEIDNADALAFQITSDVKTAEEGVTAMD